MINIAAGPMFTLGNIRLEGDAAGLMSADYGLIAGGDAGSGAVLKAEALIVRDAEGRGQAAGQGDRPRRSSPTTPPRRST